MVAAPSYILNVSYDGDREFYQEYNTVFTLSLQKKSGITPTVDSGRSSKQARAAAWRPTW
jgi:ABC-type sulfate transport system substrate-binding protein